MGRLGKGSSKGEERFAGSHPGRGTSLVGGNPCRIHRGLEVDLGGDLEEALDGLERRDGPILAEGKEGTCSGFGSRVRQEGLGG